MLGISYSQLAHKQTQSCFWDRLPKRAVGDIFELANARTELCGFAELGRVACGEGRIGTVVCTEVLICVGFFEGACFEEFTESFGFELVTPFVLFAGALRVLEGFALVPCCDVRDTAAVEDFVGVAAISGTGALFCVALGSVGWVVVFTAVDCGLRVGVVAFFVVVVGFALVAVVVVAASFVEIGFTLVVVGLLVATAVDLDELPFTTAFAAVVFAD